MKKTMKSLILIVLAILLATTFAACGDEQTTDAGADASLRINAVTYPPEAYINEPYDLRDVIMMEEGVTYSATAFYVETVRDEQTNVYTSTRHALEVEDLVFTPVTFDDTVVTLTAQRGNSTYSKVVTISTTARKEPLDELYCSTGLLAGADSGITKTVNFNEMYLYGENSQSSLHVEFNSVDPHAFGNTFMELSAPLAQQHFTDQDWNNAIVTFWIYNPMDKDIEFQLAIVDKTHPIMTDWSPADGPHRQFAKAGQWTQIFFSLRALGTKHKLVHNEYSSEFLFLKMQYADYSLTDTYTYDFYMDNLDVVPASTYPEIDTTYTFTDETIDQGWENMSTDIGWQGVSTVYNYDEFQGEGSVCSMRATFPGEKGKTNSFICLNPAAHTEFLDLDMTGGKFSGYFKFENMPAKVSLDLINANWEVSNAVELELEDLGNGWYYGEVDMTTVHIGAGRSDNIIRIRLMFQDVTDDSVVYMDTVKYEYAYVDLVLEDMQYDWINMGMDSGMNVFKSYEYTADYKKASGSVRSIKIVADANQKASVVWHPELAVLNGQLSALPNMTKGVIRAYFYFGNQTPSATFQVINPLWHPSKEVNFIFESAGDGWYLGSVPAGLLQGFHEGNASEVIRMMINIPAGYTVYIDGLMHYPNEIYTTSINADDVFSSGIYTTSGLTGSSGANKSADGIYLWAEQAVGYPHVGVSFSTPVDISAYEDISFDIKAVGAWCWTEVKLFYLVNGAETYTSISADFGSDEWHTIVKKLTAFKGADLTQVTGIQFCVNCDDGFVKGQRNEFWFANLKLTDGSNSPADLGEAFAADRDYQISLNNTEKLDALSFDYQITNDGVLSLAILNSSWSQYFGYFDFNSEGMLGEYAGMTCQKLDNGYVRVTMDLDEIQRTNNADNRDNVPEILDFIYITNRSNTAAGYISNITLTVAEDQEPVVPEIGDLTLSSGQDGIVNLVNNGDTTALSFEYKVTSGTFNVALLMEDWSAYYGYFEFGGNGNIDSYDGVTVEELPDGYFRVTMEIASLTKMVGTPNTGFTIFYVRGDWSNAAGTIRNITLSDEPIEPSEPEPTEPEATEPEPTEPVESTYDLTSGADLTVNLENDGNNKTIIFEYKVTGTFNVAMLMEDWSAYYGYFAFDEQGNVDPYDGVTVEELPDGYFRVTLDIASLTKMVGTPNAGFTVFYVRGDWSNATGTIRNITLSDEVIAPTEPTEPEATEPEATEPEATEPETPVYAIGADVAINVEPGAYSHITFEYKITNNGSLLIGALSPDWSKYYGYYQFNASGKADADIGIYAETLSDGYIRVTMVTAELERTNNAYNTANAPETIGLLYTGQSSAAGTIRNVVCYNEGSDEPEEDMEVVVFPGADFSAGTNMNVDINAGAFDLLTFDYKIESGAQFCLALLDSSWAKYYGYYTFTVDGEVDNSQGVVCENLEDGSVRVTITLAELEKTNNSLNMDNVPNPPSVFYIRGDWSDANGTIGDISCITLKSEDLGEALAGGEFTAGANMQVELTGSVKALTFDYVINNGGQFCVALLDPSWTKYYGYYTFTVDGEVDNSQGVVCETLDNGHIRVTMTLADLQKTNNSLNLSNIPNPVSIFYIRGDWCTANGEIVSIYIK